MTIALLWNILENIISLKLHQGDFHEALDDTSKLSPILAENNWRNTKIGAILYVFLTAGVIGSPDNSS